MILIKSLILPFDHTEDDLLGRIRNRLNIGPKDLLSYRIKKRSLDARKGRPISRVYSLAVEVEHEGRFSRLIDASDDLDWTGADSYQVPAILRLPAFSRPLIVGTGPAGIFAAMILAEAGLDPLLLDRGKQVEERASDVANFWRNGKLDPESNVQYGEGGAGTFSDGKLRTRVKDRSFRTQKILDELIQAGAPQEIGYDHKPHVGTANLIRIVKNIRNKVEKLGGEYHFKAKVVDLILEESKIRGLRLDDGREFFSETVILAIGHSARDTFQMLHDRGVKMAPKPFAVGFRIEHAQEMIDRNQYGNHAGHPALGAAEYQLSCKTSTGRSVYSFCMCPGGSVIGASSEPGMVVTNGMSQHARDLPNANAAIVAEVLPADFPGGPLGGFHFQRAWEKKAFELGGGNYHAPVQLVTDFLSRRLTAEIGSVRPSYLPGVAPADLWDSLPANISHAIAEGLEIFERKISGFSTGDAILTGVETRTSSPLRILRGRDLQSQSISGLYPVGEGSGYAGGIMTSAMDGIIAAESIIQRLGRAD